MFDTIPLFVGGLPGGPEIILILVVVILLFGANKIPKLARSTGQAMGEFKKGRQEIEDELEDMTGEEFSSEDPEAQSEYDMNSGPTDSTK